MERGSKWNNLNKKPVSNSPKPLPRSSIGHEKRWPNSYTYDYQTNHEFPETDSSAYSHQKYKDNQEFLSLGEKFKQHVDKDIVEHQSYGMGNQVSASVLQKYEDNDTGTPVGHDVFTLHQGKARIEEKSQREKTAPQFDFGRGRGKHSFSTQDKFPPKDSRFYPQKKKNNYAGTKNNFENNSEDLPYLCTTCEKIIYTKSLFHHRNKMDHEVLLVNQGIAKLQEKKVTEAYNLEKKAKSILCIKKEMVGTLDSSLNLFIDPLFDAFESLKKSTAEDTNALTAFLLDVQKSVPEKSLDFVDFFQFKNAIDKLTARGDDLLLKNQCMPFWLLSAWFKISLGLMLQSGKIVCTVLDNAMSTLNIQGDRILLPCLQKNRSLDKDAVVLPFNFMAYILYDNPCAYMKISSNQKDLGYAFVRVDLETFWGRQFVEMCTGTRGYTYRDTRFFRICRRNKTGDHIWTGDYSMNDGSGGAQVLENDGQPLHTNPQPIVKGLMAARYGYQDRSTIFRIYIGENVTATNKPPPSFDVCAFGNVEDGMHYFSHMAMVPNITTGAIQDVGRILSLN